MTGRICRHATCRQPIIPCGCQPPFLGWCHAADPDHRIASHSCAMGARPVRIAEPEPTPQITLTRFIAALPRLPVIDPMAAEISWQTVVELRFLEPRWCAFCLVRAEQTIGTTATELGIDGSRWLDLCPPHAADLKGHCEQWEAPQIIAEWEAQHRRLGR